MLPQPLGRALLGQRRELGFLLVRRSFLDQVLPLGVQPLILGSGGCIATKLQATVTRMPSRRKCLLTLAPGLHLPPVLEWRRRID